MQRRTETYLYQDGECKYNRISIGELFKKSTAISKEIPRGFTKIIFLLNIMKKDDKNLPGIM